MRAKAAWTIFASTCRTARMYRSSIRIEAPEATRNANIPKLTEAVGQPRDVGLDSVGGIAVVRALAVMRRLRVIGDARPHRNGGRISSGRQCCTAPRQCCSRRRTFQFTEWIPTMAPERPTKLEDFVLLTDQFVGGGDMLAVTRIIGNAEQDAPPVSW